MDLSRLLLDPEEVHTPTFEGSTQAAGDELTPLGYFDSSPLKSITPWGASAAPETVKRSSSSGMDWTDGLRSGLEEGKPFSREESMQGDGGRAYFEREELGKSMELEDYGGEMPSTITPEEMRRLTLSLLEPETAPYEIGPIPRSDEAKEVVLLGPPKKAEVARAVKTEEEGGGAGGQGQEGLSYDQTPAVEKKGRKGRTSGEKGKIKKVQGDKASPRRKKNPVLLKDFKVGRLTRTQIRTLLEGTKDFAPPGKESLCKKLKDEGLWPEGWKDVANLSEIEVTIETVRQTFVDSFKRED